jgi:alkyl hydroperoxide reductase subunit D
VASHYKLLKDTGATVQELRDVGRIAAVIAAASQVLVAENLETSAAVVA